MAAGQLENAQNPVLTEDELEALWQLNGTPIDAVRGCAHETFISRVTLHPQKEAIHSWDGRLTYSELDRLSSLLAHQLIDLGVQPGSIVPLCFEKSKWAVVSILAVLKAGGAFSLLDVTQPEGRLRDIVEQCDAKVICTSERTSAVFAHFKTSVHLVGQSLLTETNEDVPFTESRQTDPSWPMFVCWTSGSTGKAKGIVISHTAFYSACHHQAQALGVHSSARVFDFASYSFDLAVLNAMMSLFAGACICIPSEDQRRESLTTTLRDMKATVIALPPSTCRLLEPELLPDLQLLGLVGEAVTISDLERLKGFPFEVFIGYGPAECTPISTLVPNAISAQGVSIGIGAGVGAITWVVDATNEQNLMPRGLVGELLIEGPSLAEKYLNDPAKTSASFIHDPPWLLQGSRSGAGRHGRLYKTGDLVRYDNNGSTLTFVGRKDGQIKIRGQRVEPGEVEYHVREALGVSGQIAVELVELGGDRDKSMLAVFLTATAEELFCDVARVTDDMELVCVPAEVDAALSKSLQAFMIPALYFRVAAIPLGLTGKTNHSKLKLMGSALSFRKLVELRGAAAVANNRRKTQPRSDAERTLRAVWARVLSVNESSVGVDDSFLSLGGSSLEAMKLVVEARKAGFALSVSQIFRHNTIAAQVKSLRKKHLNRSVAPRLTERFSLLQDSKKPTAQELTSLCGLTDSTLIEDAYPCTPLQAHIYLIDRRPGDYLLRAILDISELVDLDALKLAWEIVFSALPILRTRIVKHERLGLIQVVCRDAIEWNESGDLQKTVDGDLSVGMKLGERLTRFTLIDTTKDGPAGRRQLVWTIFHPLYDGWSIPLMLNLVKGVLQDKVKPEDIANRPSFKDFVRHLTEKSVSETKAYWQGYLASVNPRTFPVLPSAVENPVANAVAMKELVVPSAIRGEYTMSTIIRGALGVLLSFHTNTADVVFGVTVWGRSAAMSGIEDVLGPTIAIVPVRVRTDGHLRVGELLQQLQQDSTEMIEHEQVGIPSLRDFSQDCQKASGFQTLMVVHPQGDIVPSDNVLGSWRTVPPELGLRAHALTLQFMTPASGDIAVVNAMYDDRIIDGGEMGKMLGQLEVILEAMGRSSSLQVKELCQLLKSHAE